MSRRSRVMFICLIKLFEPAFSCAWGDWAGSQLNVKMWRRCVTTLGRESKKQKRHGIRAWIIKGRLLRQSRGGVTCNRSDASATTWGAVNNKCSLWERLISRPKHKSRRKAEEHVAKKKEESMNKRLSNAETYQLPPTLPFLSMEIATNTKTWSKCNTCWLLTIF